MSSDEQQIQALVADWMAATRAGDVDAVLRLMSDDVVFLRAGRPPMGKDEFAAAARAQAGPEAPRIEGRGEIVELEVAGDWAWAWSRLSVVVAPADGSEPIERAGDTLTVFRRQGGRWFLSRDANLLGPVEREI
jgi:uncharacterized protein (TIGR02246 family)